MVMENKMQINEYADLLQDVKQCIRSAQYKALRAVNKELISLYWNIGKMIVTRQKQYGWGKAIVETLAKDLQAEFPGMQGFSPQNLWYMRQFYDEYHKNANLQPLVGEISWAKHLVIMGKCKDNLEREFYIKMTRKFGWTKNVLIHQIENQSYEKTLLGQTNFNKTLPAPEQIRKLLDDEVSVATRAEQMAVNPLLRGGRGCVMKIYYNLKLKELARKFRNNNTLSEVLLWQWVKKQTTDGI